jgi:hypothetical protein
MECKKTSNLKICTCTYEPCSRKGLCCECIMYHKSHDELPGCFFDSETEKTYDRSIKRFLDSYKRKSRN